MDIEKSLEKIKDGSKAIVNLCRQIGPWVISYCDQLSKLKTAHDLRTTGVKLLEKEMALEIETIAGIKKSKMEQYYSASKEERIFIRRDIDELEKEGRRFQTMLGAVNLLPEQTTDESEKEISPHWIDKFNELARARNEDWRQELLSKALALEATKPGSISPRALWLIGTLEEEAFHAYATLLDLSSNIGGGYIIPDEDKYENTRIPSCPLGKNPKIGNLTFMLSDLGLLGDFSTSVRTFESGKKFIASYDSEKIEAEFLKDIKIRGAIPTKLGHKVAKLYTPKRNTLGEEIFKSWLEKASKNQIKILESS